MDKTKLEPPFNPEFKNPTPLEFFNELRLFKPGVENLSYFRRNYPKSWQDFVKAMRHETPRYR